MPHPNQRMAGELTCDSSHHMPTPPLATFPDRTKKSLSGLSRSTHVLVSLEMVVTTPGGSYQPLSVLNTRSPLTCRHRHSYHVHPACSAFSHLLLLEAFSQHLDRTMGFPSKNSSDYPTIMCQIHSNVFGTCIYFIFLHLCVYKIKESRLFGPTAVFFFIFKTLKKFILLVMIE